MEPLSDAAPAGVLEPAGFWVRGGALLVDTAVSVAIGLAYGKLSAMTGLENAVILPFGVAVGCAYAVLPVGAWGQTPGKWLAGVRVVAADGAPAGYGRAALRMVGTWLTGLTLNIGLLPAAFPGEKRVLHDYMAGTRVVLVPGVSWARRAAMVVLGALFPAAVFGGGVYLGVRMGREAAAYRRAQRAEERGDHQAAIEVYDEFIERQPENPTWWNNRCWSKALAGRAEEALPDCEKSLSLRPSAAAYDSKGLALLKLGRHAESAASYDEALRMNPGFAHSLYGRGLAKRGAGDRAGCDADVAAALKVDPDVAGAYDGYGLDLR